jgi:hypothetical protein
VRSSHLSREYIRNHFYEGMDAVTELTTQCINELFNHHGCVQPYIKEYYRFEGCASLDEMWDHGAMLQIDEIYIGEEWLG